VDQCYCFFVLCKIALWLRRRDYFGDDVRNTTSVAVYGVHRYIHVAASFCRQPREFITESAVKICSKYHDQSVT